MQPEFKNEGWGGVCAACVQVCVGAALFNNEGVCVCADCVQE